MARLLAGLLFASLATAQLCDQPFSPTREGWEWQYRVVEGNKTGTRIVRKTALKAGSYVQYTKEGDDVREVLHRCTPEGLVPVEIGRLTGFKAEVLKASGVSTPDYDSWEVGSNWKYVLEINGERTEFPPVKGHGFYETAYRVLGRETVTVPAGKFNAFKVEVTTTMRFTIPPGIPFNQGFSLTSWYAEGVGMVKSTNQRSTVELLVLKK
jgi:hypothetical protein